MSSYKFTSGPLVAKIRERHGLSESEAKQAIGLTFDAIAESLNQADDKVRVSGFGTFTKKLQPARDLRNPRTGESIRTTEKIVIKFKMAGGS